MRKIGCAVVGLGAIGPTHVKSVAALEETCLVAVCYIVRDKAEKFAREYGCKAYTDFQQVLDDPEVELVHICLPSGMHAKFGIRAAKAGKHVLVEKPIDVNLEAADALIAACHENRVVLSCISQHRFDPDIVKMKEMLDDGAFGRVVFGGSYTKWFRDQAYYDSGDWRGTWELDGGGSLMNQSVHYVDMLQYLAGEIDEVTAYTGLMAHERIEVEDLAVAIVRFKNGALGALEGSTVAKPGFHTRLDINGTEGSFIIENDRVRICRPKDGYPYQESSPNDSTQPTGAGSAEVTGGSHAREIRDVAIAITEGREPAITGEKARKPLAVILAVYESARTGKAVKV